MLEDLGGKGLWMYTWLVDQEWLVWEVLVVARSWAVSAHLNGPSTASFSGY